MHIYCADNCVVILMMLLWKSTQTTFDIHFLKQSMSLVGFKVNSIPKNYLGMYIFQTLFALNSAKKLEV